MANMQIVQKDASTNIAKLIYDYNKLNKQVDTNFIEKLVEIFVNAYKIEQYINNIKIFEETFKKTATLAKYNIIFNDIKIFLPNIKNDLRLKEKSYKNQIDVMGKSLFIYTYYATIIIHELFHAFQLKLKDYSASIVEREILSTVSKLRTLYDYTLSCNSEPIPQDVLNQYINDVMAKHEENYVIAPHEKHASVCSYALIASSISEIEQGSKLKAYNEVNFYNNLLRGYNITDIPIKRFFEETYSSLAYEKIEQLLLQEKISDFTKTLYGLDVDKDYLFLLQEERNKALSLLK